MEAGNMEIYEFVIAGIAIWIGLKILFAPLKLIAKLALNAFSGYCLLLTANWVGGLFGYTLPITLWTSLAAGICGIPGVIAVMLYDLLL